MASYKPIPPLSIRQQARFWDLVHKDAGCWQWLGTLSGDYGMFGGFRAHRVSYALIKGAPPPELTLDHTCRNTQCVNPDHLEPVTGAVNTMRGDSPMALKARQTHCLNGHEFTPDNIITRKGRRGRECRICYNDRQRRTWHEGKRKRGPNG